MYPKPASLNIFMIIDSKGFDTDPFTNKHASIIGAFKTCRYVVMYL